MSISKRAIPIAAIVGALALSSCGGESSDPAAAEPRSTSVDVVNIAYAPSTLEVRVGDEVVWTNMDEGVGHTVTSGTPGDDGVPGVSKGTRSKPDGVFDGDLSGSASEFTFTFEEVGTFRYFCRVHPSMVGKIVVR